VFSRFSDIRTAAPNVAPIWEGKKYFLATPLQKSIFKHFAYPKNYIFQNAFFD